MAQCSDTLTDDGNKYEKYINQIAAVGTTRITVPIEDQEGLVWYINIKLRGMVSYREKSTVVVIRLVDK